MEWISIKDMLPDDGETVLTFRPLAPETGDDIFVVQKFHSRNYMHTSPQGVVHGFDRWCHPTHWMPLPGPPKKLP